MIKLNKIFETKTDKIVQGGVGAFVVLGTVIHFGFLSGSGLTEEDLLSGRYYAIFDETDLIGKDLDLGTTCEEMFEAAKDNKTSDMLSPIGSYIVFQVSNSSVSSVYGVNFTYNDCRDDYGLCSADSSNGPLPALQINEVTSSGLPTELQAGVLEPVYYDYSNLRDGTVVQILEYEGSLLEYRMRVCIQP